uniref:HORMA domain-containing protein n=2 Tax=Percolomonas cosmopolitus TaxID=63605 RepID=A0A7S1KMJ1_9EUKA
MPSTSVQQTHHPSLFTQSQSTKIISNFIKTFLSEILFLRGVLEENSFRAVNMSGLNLHVLSAPDEGRGIQETSASAGDKPSRITPVSTAPEVVDETDGTIPKAKDNELYERVKAYMAGIDDAIEKKYLRLIIIAFHDPTKSSSHNFDSISESYEIHLKYLDNNNLSVSWRAQQGQNADKSKDNAASSARELSTDEIKASLQGIFRNLTSFMTILLPLPKDAFLTIKLAYTPDTPMDYEPLGFEACEPKGGDHYKSMPVNDLGIADSKYHASSVVFRCERHLIEGGQVDEGKGPVTESAADLMELDVHTENLSTLSSDEAGRPPSAPAPRVHKPPTVKKSGGLDELLQAVPTCTDPYIAQTLSNISDNYLRYVLYTLSGEYVTVPKFSEAFGLDRKLGTKVVKRLISDGLLHTDSRNKRAGRKTYPNPELKKRIEKHFDNLRKNGVQLHTPTPPPYERKHRKRGRSSPSRGYSPSRKKVRRSSKSKISGDDEDDDSAYDFDASNADEFTFIPDQANQKKSGKIPSLVPPVEPRRLRLQSENGK